MKKERKRQTDREIDRETKKAKENLPNYGDLYYYVWLESSLHERKKGWRLRKKERETERETDREKAKEIKQIMEIYSIMVGWIAPPWKAKKVEDEERETEKETDRETERR